ncbi:AprI/Inh family metalloprotease inhibitor [Rouxiella sp. Mn2063]|uniref:AprI/Inh family metalloprotease inhibitor n=1 Tax=Rouxiella sp. Mn2063 TaxID=3395262 RepID=UPI003BD8552A
MASSMVLPSAESLSGEWTVADKAQSCVVHLSAQSDQSANGFQLRLLSDCPHDVLPQAPVAWRPTPDGIALLDKEGLTVVFFSQDGEHYRSQIWDSAGKILTRNKP